MISVLRYWPALDGLRGVAVLAVMLGGLISETATDSDSGVPGLKDIPGVGNLFKRSSQSRTRTELVILITPYILNDASEAENATDAYQATLGAWAQSVRDRVKASREAHKLNMGTQPLQGSSGPSGPSITGDNSTIKPAAPAEAPGNGTPAPAGVQALQPDQLNQQNGAAALTPSTAVPPTAGATSERMINLSNRNANVINPADSGASAATNGGGSVTQGANPADGNSAAPTGKPAPSTINGVNVPAGATVVEDPDLIREILNSTKQR